MIGYIYIYHILWFTYHKYALLQFIAYQFLKELLCAILMKLRNKSIFVMLVAFIKTFQLALLPLLLAVMFLRFYLVEVHSYTISEKWSHRLYMLLSKHPLVYVITSSWISYLIYFVNFLCVHVSLWIICPL